MILSISPAATPSTPCKRFRRRSAVLLPAILFPPVLLPIILLLSACVPVGNRYASVSVDPDAERRAASSPASLDHIGTAALRSGDAATAQEFFDRALSLEPEDRIAARGAAEAATRSGRVNEAIDTLRRAAPHVDGTVRADLDAALGKLLVLDHRPIDAEATFRDGLRVAPGSPPLLTGLGIALDGQHRFADAVHSFRAALAQLPNDLPARNDLALSIALAGDTDAALTQLRALRAEAFGLGADENAIRTVDGNIALVQAMRGDVPGAQETDAGAAGNRDDPVRNAAFYSALAGVRVPVVAAPAAAPHGS